MTKNISQSTIIILFVSRKRIKILNIFRIMKAQKEIIRKIELNNVDFIFAK